MEWSILAPAPGPVDFSVGGLIACVAFLVAWVPLALAARHALGLRLVERERLQWRVVEGGKGPPAACRLTDGAHTQEGEGQSVPSPGRWLNNVLEHRTQTNRAQTRPGVLQIRSVIRVL